LDSSANAGNTCWRFSMYFDGFWFMFAMYVVYQ
jgi:hypothetical protein